MSLFRPYELTSTSTPTTPSVTATSGGPPVPAAPPTSGPLGSATPGGHPPDLSGANMQMAMFLAAHTAAAAARAAEMELLRHQSGSSPLNPQVGILLSNFYLPHQCSGSGAHLPLFSCYPTQNVFLSF